ncbi:hypothetical protein CHUAL_005594 [Chamberlinius hualienensis]
MDLVAIRGLNPEAGPAAHEIARKYFESLKAREDGWRLCITTLLSDDLQSDYDQFFCFQVLEYFVKSHYANCDNSQQQFLRQFYCFWIQKRVSSGNRGSSFLCNKVAQVLSLIFLVDYPHRWETFFDDFIKMLNLGPVAVDMYLRLLKAINSEVVDREIAPSTQEAQRNTMIKDTLREKCVFDLVSSWLQILITYETTSPELANQCLEVIGAYTSWIDINLIANDRFVELLVRYIQRPEMRENACDCVYEIIGKGMDPVAKTKLVEFFFTKLHSVRIFDILLFDEDIDFEIKLAKLVNRIGTTLILSCLRLVKVGDNDALLLAVQAVESKFPLILKYLDHEDDDVSGSVIECVKDYVQLLKQIPRPSMQNNLQNILFILMKKYKYDESYRFYQERDDEAMFLQFRKNLKVLFDYIAGADRDLVLKSVSNLFISTMQVWQQAKVEDVELAITFLYLLGEAIPATQGNHFVSGETKASVIQEMMRLLISSHVSHHPHPVVSLQFFETVSRYEKFFNCELGYFPEVLSAFLDKRGLKNGDKRVRSRTAYLFSRMVKSLKQHMQVYTEDILIAIQDLLVLSFPGNDLSEDLLSPDDQLYLYETVSILIVSSPLEVDKKRKLLNDVLSPVINSFNIISNRLTIEMDEKQQVILAECLIHAMAVTSRTSKAFSNQQTMKTTGCVQTYIDCLQAFLTALQQPHQLPILQSGFRQFLHRMVVCLEEEILAYFPITAESLLKSSDSRSIQEFIPLVNQVITKFKLSWVFQKEVVPFLQQVFKPLVTVIACALEASIDVDDQQAVRDKQTLRRSYFSFIATIVTNNVTDVLSSQDFQVVNRVLEEVMHAVDFPDPMAQKICVSILKKLIETWGGANGVDWFEQFMFTYILPACFNAPLKNTFDMNDAQTILVLNEIAACIKAMYNIKGEKTVHYMKEVLNNLNVSQQIQEEYCQALRSELKLFKSYQKTFYRRLRN